MKTPPIDRRRFLSTSSLTAAALLLGRHAAAQTPTLRVRAAEAGSAVSNDFIGLSYENMQLEDPSFFSARNTGLVEQFRAISPRGVLRLGGNTSEFNWWKADPGQPAPVRKLVLKNGDRPQDTLYAITPETIRELDGFLKATGWSCIYGLNLGFGSPATDVPEAEFVFNTLGPRLQYFQIGNEVDMFVQYHLRDADTWNVNLYLQQWLVIAVPSRRPFPRRSSACRMSPARSNGSPRLRINGAAWRERPMSPRSRITITSPVLPATRRRPFRPSSRQTPPLRGRRRPPTRRQQR